MNPLDSIRAHSTFGKTVETVSAKGIPYFVNQFWTSGQRQSHSLHEISYRACFKAELPEFFINLLSDEHGTVYDPFVGRGTTVIQAAMMNRKSIGNDVNPLSKYLIEPRLNVPSIRDIESRLLQIPITANVDKPELSVFYHPDTLMRISALKKWFIDREAGGTLDYIDSWIRMVTLNRLTGHSAGFLSVYSLPPNQAVSIESQKKINAKLNQVPPYRDLTNIVVKKTKALIKSGLPSVMYHPEILTSEAWNTPTITDASIDLVVTSPPFLDIVQYATDNWLRCWFCGIDPSTINFSQLGNVGDWTAMMRDVLIEQARIVKSGGYVAIEVGEAKKVALEELVWIAADGLPFERLGVIVNQANFTKTSNIWNIANNLKGTNSNRIVLLRRI